MRLWPNVQLHSIISRTVISGKSITSDPVSLLISIHIISVEFLNGHRKVIPSLREIPSKFYGPIPVNRETQWGKNI